MQLSEIDLLKFAVESGMLNLDAVQQQVEMNERQKYLNMHQYDIWQSESDGNWRTYLPDEVKGRKQVKRKHRKDIDTVIIEYYREQCKNEVQEKKGKSETLKIIYPKWLDFKQIHTNSTSYIKRITTDWLRFYEQEQDLINMPLSEMTKMQLDEWAHGIIKKYNMTKKCYYNMSIILRQCLDYAVELGILEENVFSKVKINSKLFVKAKKKPSDTQVYSYQEEIDLINDMIRRFENNPKSTAPLMVMLAFETGVRIGELCALKFSDIEGNYIHIQRQEIGTFKKTEACKMKFDKYEIVEYTKSDDGYRDIFLTETAKNIIEVARTMNEINREKNKDGFIFCKNGKNINHYSVMAMIRRGCEYININIKTSHKIRKTYISTLIDSGLNIDEIRRMAGHSDERTTYGNYCFNRLTNSETEDTIEKALTKHKVIKSNQILNVIEFEKKPILRQKQCM